MRQLILWRHAKSSWSQPGLSDHDRPLKQRGINDCALMAPVLERLIHADPGTLSIRVSSAQRARQTLDELRAHCVQANSRHQIDQRTIDPSLYTFDSGRLVEIINQTAAEVARLMLVGHNPALTSLAQTLGGHAGGDLARLPTGAVLVFARDHDHPSCLGGDWQLAQSSRPRHFRV